MDTRKDLLKLYHPSRQTPKEVATASDVVMDAMYWNGCPAGSFSKTFSRYRNDMPKGIVVYGNSTYKRYRFKGGTVTNPESEVFHGNSSTNWVLLDDGCCDGSLPIASVEVEPPVHCDQYRETLQLNCSGRYDVSEQLVKQLKLGGFYYLPEGDYLLREPANVVIPRSIDILAHPNAVIYGGTASKKLDGSMITLRPDSSSMSTLAKGINVKWSGGTFDLTNVKNSKVTPYSTNWPPVDVSSVSNVTDALDIRGAYGNPQGNGFDRVTVTGVKFYSGDHWETSGGDSHLFVDGAESTHIFNNVFIGSRDSAVYISGGEPALEGHHGFVYDNKFVNCFSSVAAKRQYNLCSITSNIIENSPIAIHIAALTGPSGQGMVSGNILRNYGVGIRMDQCTSTVVDNNVGYSSGFTDASGNQPNSTDGHVGGLFTNPQLVLARGVVDCAITNNKAMNTNYTNQTVVVDLLDNTSNTLVAMNSGTNVHTTVQEAATCSGNHFVNNIDVATGVPSSYLGTP